MRPFRSSQNQCCCCVVAFLLPLGSVIMTGIGVCIILKYVMIRTELLLPELQNHDGQKIVGIIVTCVGVLGIIISAIVAILYFTVCHESRSGQPAVAQKIYKNGTKIDSDLPATPKTMQANGQNQLHNSHLHPPKSPSKPSKLKSPFDSERINSDKLVSTIGIPLTSTPRRIRGGGKSGRPLSSNLEVVEEVAGDVQLPQLQVNGIDISLRNSFKDKDKEDDDDVFHNGKNDIILKPIIKPSSTTTIPTTTTTTTTTTAATATTNTSTTSNITSNNSTEAAAAALAAAAADNTNSVSRSLFPMTNIPHSSIDNNHNNNNSNNNNNNNTTTTKASALRGSHTSCLHSKSDHGTTTTTTTTTITEVHQTNCDSDQDGQTQDSDCEITSSRL